MIVGSVQEVFVVQERSFTLFRKNTVWSCYHCDCDNYLVPVIVCSLLHEQIAMWRYKLNI